MDIGYAYWNPIDLLSTCTPIDHPEYIMPFGQTVDSKLMADVTKFYCLNRGDANPFLITNNRSNETEADSQTWTQWINKPCDHRTYRRCLGIRPDQCVNAYRK